MREPGLAVFSRADKWFLSRVQSLVGLELATLTEGLGAVRVVTRVWLLTGVRSHVCSQRLFTRKDSIAMATTNGTLDGVALVDQRVDHGSFRASPFRKVAADRFWRVVDDIR